ncbi:MAG: twin-arginine translocase TatA/TatE family subunit [Candidatus Aminicenantes bacterium]|nr:twin-arginine translocase TatA/TatE family subunit [Candidatus Aminicenantes bacterium]
MFGSIGFPELIMIFIVVLLVFGPKKLPEFAKLLGKAIREFRSTIDEAKSVIEDEIYKENMASPLKDIEKDIKDALNVYSDIDKPIKAMGKDIQDALNMDVTAGSSKKGKDDEKSK